MLNLFLTTQIVGRSPELEKRELMSEDGELFTKRGYIQRYTTKKLRVVETSDSVTPTLD